MQSHVPLVTCQYFQRWNNNIQRLFHYGFIFPSFFLLDHTVKHSLRPSNSLLNFFTPTLLICFFYVSSNMARKYWWYKLSFVRAGTTTTHTYHKIYSFTENGYQTLTYLLNLNADVAIFNSFTCNFMED